MRNMYAFLCLCFLISTVNLSAQNTFPATGSAGIGTTSPNASALLEVKSTTKGFLLPRMTLAQRNAIPSPAQGLVIFQTNSKVGFYYYDGKWKAFANPNGFATIKLDNLDAVTAINQNLLPELTNSKNLGSSSFAWKDLYLGGIGYIPTVKLGNYAGTPQAGMLRYSGSNFQGYNGSSWINLSGGTTYTAGTGISLASNVITNTAPDVPVTLTGGGASTVSGAYPNFTITSTDNNTTYTAGTGIDITGTTISNTAPSQWNTSGSNISYAAGNVGIGTSPPAYKLDVNGDINISTGSVLRVNGNTVFKYDDYKSIFAGLGAGISSTGLTNTGYGYNALHFNTAGVDNVAIGTTTLYNNTMGNSNTAIGSNVLASNTTGSYNTGIGEQSLSNTTIGTGNMAVGHHTLTSNIIGNNNTSIGNETDVNADDYVNTTVIGYGTLGTASNQVRIGNNDVTSIGGPVDWSVTSDGRVKKNIKQNVPGLAFINKLNPVTYNLDLDLADKLTQRPAIKDNEGKMMQASQQALSARKAKMQVLYTGFVAQDVEKAARSLNYNFSGVDAPKNDKDLYGLRYAQFVVPLVKAVQELSKQNDAKDEKISELEARLSKLEAMMAGQPVVNGQQSTTGNVQSAVISSALLEQNAPNPFSNTTTIGYYLPANIASAKIIITDKNGKTLKELNVSGKGKRSLTVDASTLANGAYQYALYVNNKLIDAKQMLRTK